MGKRRRHRAHDFTEQRRGSPGLGRGHGDLVSLAQHHAHRVVPRDAPDEMTDVVAGDHPYDQFVPQLVQRQNRVGLAETRLQSCKIGGRATGRPEAA